MVDDNPAELAARQLSLWARSGLSHLPRSPEPRAEAEPPQAAESVETESPGAWGSLDACRRDAESCTRCSLSRTRQKVVFGDGSPEARLMFVGEAPGAEEDARGLPFVGRAGQLLDKMIAAMGLRRDEVYIANVLKCRPPNNRDPEADEVAACRPFLDYQLELIRPRVVCCLGRHAAARLLQTQASLKDLRGRLHPLTDGTVAAVTYHPAYCLRNPHAKRDVWDDLQMVMAELGLSVPEKSD